MADLYQSLGVGKDASPDDIKRAHRQGVQQHHPDKGGDRDAFEAVQHAYVVLSDPERRSRYDATGDADTSPEQNEMAEIAAMVIGAFDRAIGNAKDRFAKVDIVDAMLELLLADHKRGEEANLLIAKGKANMEDMRKRLGFDGETGRNLIDSTLLQRIRDADDQADSNLKTMSRLMLAIEHVELYGWEVDPEPQAKPYGFGGTMSAEMAREIMGSMKRDSFAEMMGGRSGAFDINWVDPVKKRGDAWVDASPDPQP